MLKKFAGNAFFYIAGMLLNRGLGFLLLPIYTRHLSPADYGILATCLTATSLFAVLSTLSLEAAVIIFYHKMKTEEYAKLLQTIWAWTLLVPLLEIAILEVIGPPLVARLLPTVPWNPYFRLALWIAYLGIAFELILALVRTEQRALLYGLLTIASFLLTTGLLLYFVAVRGGGALGSLYGQVLAALIMALASHVLILRRFRFWSWPFINWNHLVVSLKLGVPYLPHIFCMWMLNISDRWILGRYVPISALGIYNLAYTLGMIVHLFGTGLATAYGPIYYQSAEDETFRRRLPRLLTAYLLIPTWVLLAISLMAPEILRVMTRPAFYDAAELVPWVAAGYWFYVSVYQLGITVVIHHQRTIWTILLTGPSAVFNACMNLLFVPRFGILAAAVNTMLSFMLMGGLALLASRKLDKLPFAWRSIFKMLLVAAAAFWVGNELLTLPNLITAIIAKGLVLAVAAAAMAWLSGFSAKEVWALRKRIAGTKTAIT